MLNERARFREKFLLFIKFAFFMTPDRTQTIFLHVYHISRKFSFLHGTSAFLFPNGGGYE